eukprot:COSAG05_NODE_89_length_20177_cov_197.003586_6_plen_235_part_00
MECRHYQAGSPPWICLRFNSGIISVHFLRCLHRLRVTCTWCASRLLRAVFSRKAYPLRWRPLSRSPPVLLILPGSIRCITNLSAQESEAVSQQTLGTAMATVRAMHGEEPPMPPTSPHPWGTGRAAISESATTMQGGLIMAQAPPRSCANLQEQQEQQQQQIVSTTVAFGAQSHDGNAAMRAQIQMSHLETAVREGETIVDIAARTATEINQQQPQHAGSATTSVTAEDESCFT